MRDRSRDGKPNNSRINFFIGQKLLFFSLFFAFFFPGSIMFNQNVPRGGGLDGAFDKELDGCSAIMVIGNVQHLQ
jgi:heme/copper-type cytochrome/quinol oxidase subunit 3